MVVSKVDLVLVLVEKDHRTLWLWGYTWRHMILHLLRQCSIRCPCHNSHNRPAKQCPTCHSYLIACFRVFHDRPHFPVAFVRRASLYLVETHLSLLALMVDP